MTTPRAEAAGGRTPRTGGRCRLVAALLAGAVATGCDRPFEPLGVNENGPFSMVGYLDLGADTQWVRVSPIRQSLFADPEPIDAVVTLERVGSGRVVTMRDSLFTFEDARLDGVAYAHVFWTPERLEPNATYRVSATRSDGASSTAVVGTPADLELSLRNLESGRDTGWLEVTAERVLFIESLHTTSSLSGEPGGSVAKRQLGASPAGAGAVHFLSVDGTPPILQDQVAVGRTELRIATATSSWPARLSPAAAAAAGDPDTLPSNVENGLGYLGAAATWTIPFHYCAELAPRSDDRQACTIIYNSRSASVSGRVFRQPCARPHALGEVRLTERFASGGAVTRRWKTGWDGSYRFEGIEPGAEISLVVGSAAGAPVATPVTVPLPRLGPGQRHAVQDVSVSVVSGC